MSRYPLRKTSARKDHRDSQAKKLIKKRTRKPYMFRRLRKLENGLLSLEHTPKYLLNRLVILLFMVSAANLDCQRPRQ